MFIATLIRSAFGFGEALIAVPLLAFCIPLGVAAPLAVLASITVAAIVVVQDWKKIHIGSTGWLVLSSFFGIPLGLLLLTSSHQRVVKAALAVIILTFSVYSLIARTALELRRDSRAWLLACGFCAGRMPAPRRVACWRLQTQLLLSRHFRYSIAPALPVSC